MVSVTAHLALSPEAEPWREALRFRLEVDGEPVHTPRSAPGGVFGRPWGTYAAAYGPKDPFSHAHPCSDGPRTVSVAVVADAPGFDPLRTDALDVHLTCEDAPDPTGADGEDLGATDLGLDTEPGCGCHHTPAAPSSGPLVLLITALALLRRPKKGDRHHF